MTYITISKYRKSDFRRLSWQEYAKTLETLYRKVNNYVKKNHLKIDAVVPILRGGAFPGTYLAYKLDLLRVIPVQYRYFIKGKTTELRKVMNFSRKDVKLPAKPTFLLVEGNHCFGVTASTAAKDLKKNFPSCRIIYAADHIDYSYQKIGYVDAVFYGRLTNETKILTPKQCKTKGIANVCYLFPWENLEEEWLTVQSKQFPYKDLDGVWATSKKRVVM
ncbi:MAG: phosphoribosyltransferase [Candidatus Colwellbacteria bacterium]|nr:phosphoribosyltransferase [Candidatus Colwellbacteria bacterium]